MTRSSWAIAALLTLAGGLFMLSPTSAAMDRALSAVRYGVVQRVASGRVVVVEMDAKSTAVIQRWPWSRTNYAAVIDRLKAAGAASIVFDVEFSSPSDRAGDASFAASLARADGLVALPTFGQQASSADRRTIDALPIPALRAHAALASVSIQPDMDGQVRNMPLGTITQGTPRPSLSAYIAQRSGAAGTQFPIDMGIDPATIPRLSFVDVRDGRFDPAAVRGRNILIGATAIEMGDRYAVPLWGIIPGVIVQAMAAETLLRGVPVGGSALITFLIASIAVIAIARMRSGLQILAAVVGAQIVIVATALIAQAVLLMTFPLAGALVMVTLAGLTCGARELARYLRMQRMIDEATGLPNTRSLATATGRDWSGTLMVAQIDNYESLLAVLGPPAVADVLKRVSDRLVLATQSELVYRTGDRQLTCLLPPDGYVEDRLDGLRAILLRPIEVAGRRVDVAVSVGVAAGRGAGLERQLADATLAADDALSAGAFWRHSAGDDQHAELSITLMGELDAALTAGEIQVFYQPKYNLHEQRVTSVEALVRWHHPERGAIAPDVFVTLAEKTNRIGPLTLYVLHRVASDLQIWRQAHRDVTAAVNISAKLLSDAVFNADVERILASCEVPATSFIFEVTESAAMSDPASAISALQHYRKLGIAVSMDDYGTGQSTLTYLRQLPLNELKIDRSFVQHAHEIPNDGVLVRSTIGLAHDLGLKVVAEGVEDLGCLTFLKGCGCDLIQGYFISPPLPCEDMIEFLHTKTAIAA